MFRMFNMLLHPTRGITRDATSDMDVRFATDLDTHSQTHDKLVLTTHNFTINNLVYVELITSLFQRKTLPILCNENVPLWAFRLLSRTPHQTPHESPNNHKQRKNIHRRSFLTISYLSSTYSVNVLDLRGDGQLQ